MTKILTIVVFALVITLVLAALAMVMWAEHVPAYFLLLLALLELIFVGCAFIWTLVSICVKRDQNKLGK